MKGADLPEFVYHMVRVIWWKATGDPGPDWVDIGKEGRENWTDFVEAATKNDRLREMKQKWPDALFMEDLFGIGGFVFVALVNAMKIKCEEERVKT